MNMQDIYEHLISNLPNYFDVRINRDDDNITVNPPDGNYRYTIAPDPQYPDYANGGLIYCYDDGGIEEIGETLSYEIANPDDLNRLVRDIRVAFDD